VYDKTLAVVEAMPSPRAFIGGNYEYRGGRCVIGELLRHEGVDPSAFNGRGDVTTIAEMSEVVVKAFDKLGLSVGEAKQLQAVNDCYHFNNEQRYNAVRRWLRERVQT